MICHCVRFEGISWRIEIEAQPFANGGSVFQTNAHMLEGGEHEPYPFRIREKRLEPLSSDEKDSLDRMVTLLQRQFGASLSCEAML